LPIVGDSTYGGVAAARMMLHCRAMAFTDERGRQQTVSAPLDEEFARICGEFGVSGPALA
jgi:23S rRNA-/tRNA-specific pseudouridylate synthase